MVCTRARVRSVLRGPRRRWELRTFRGVRIDYYPSNNSRREVLLRRFLGRRRRCHGRLGSRRGS